MPFSRGAVIVLWREKKRFGDMEISSSPRVPDGSECTMECPLHSFHSFTLCCVFALFTCLSHCCAKKHTPKKHTKNSFAQVDPEEMGAWYMYIFNTPFKNDSLWAIKCDIQHRNFNVIGDLQQLLIRGGITYMPKESPLKLTFGYAYIGNGTPGDSKETSAVEHRFYQETSFPVKLGKKLFLLLVKQLILQPLETTDPNKLMLLHSPEKF